MKIPYVHYPYEPEIRTIPVERGMFNNSEFRPCLYNLNIYKGVWIMAKQKVNMTKEEGKELLKKILVHSEKKGIPTFPKKKKT